MSGIPADVAELLQAEVAAIVEDVSSYLFNEPLEMAPVEQGLRTLEGTCRLLELSSLVTLLSSFSKAVTTLVDRGISPLNHQTELASILDVIPEYFKALPEIRAEIPFLFLPELALLRKLQGLPPLYEFQVLSGHEWPDSSRFEGRTPLDEELQAALKKLKQLYQMGLLDVLRGNEQQKGAELLAKVTAKLSQILDTDAEKHYWKLVNAVTQAYAREALSFNPVRMRLLAAVERQLKSLLDNDLNKNPYPLGLWRAYAILLAMVADQDDNSRALCEWAGAPRFDFVDRDMDEIRSSLFDDQSQYIGVFVASLGAKLGQLHSLLERIDSQGHLSSDEAAGFAGTLADLANLCESHGLRKAAQRIKNHLKSCPPEGESEWQPDSGLLRDTAHTILYLECLVLQLRDNSSVMPGLLHKLDRREIDEVVAQNLVSTSQHAVWEECLRKLSDVKTLVDEISTDMAGSEVQGELADTFAEIQGAATMVNNNQVMQIARRCKAFVCERLFAEGQPPSQGTGKLALFADAVVALEYFFSNALHGQQTEFVLAIAEDYLTGLEV